MVPVLILILVTTILVTIIGSLIGLTVLGATLLWLFLVLLILFGFLLLNSYIFIDEQHIGMLFHRNGNFSRFIDSGWQRIIPFVETLENKIPKGRKIFNHQEDDPPFKWVRTKEGIPLTVHWVSFYQIDINQLLQGPDRTPEKAKNAHRLKILPPGRVKNGALAAIRAVIETKSIRQIYEHTEGEGAIRLLQEEVTEKMRAGLKDTIFLPNSSQVILGPIKMPKMIEDALSQAHERELHTSAVANGLEKLHKVINAFGDRHMHTLAELERLRIIGKRGTLFSYKSVDHLPANGSPSEQNEAE